MGTFLYCQLLFCQVFVEKKDTHTGYAFTAKYERSKEQVSGMTYEKKVLHLSVDTPGSQVDRKLLIEGVYNPAEMIASAQLQSPWTKLEWTSKILLYFYFKYLTHSRSYITIF